MRTLIIFQNKRIPVYINQENKQPIQKTLRLLASTLDNKITTGKRALQKCLNSLISIEVIGCEAILHSISENDSLALSLY